jgi:hypothetical protein
MNQLTRSARLSRGRRRIALCVNLAPDIHKELGKIAGGNRSAAIEDLVRRHLAGRLTSVPEPIT